MDTITGFYITTSLNDNQHDQPAYRAGSAVEGKVIVIVGEAEATTGPLKITLSGRAEVQWRQFVPFSNDHTIFYDMTAYLWGTGCETLASGRHEFPYMFNLPTGIPSSHEDHYGHIRYTLTAVLPTRKSEVTRMKRINVHEIVDVDRPELLTPLHGSDRKTLGCLCCTLAPIELTVSTEQGGYVCGERIVIRENHRCRRITNVNGTLFRKTVYLARPSASKFTCQDIASTSLFHNDIPGEPEKIGFIYIPTIVPSINCDILTVSYFLRVNLEFKLPMVKRLSVEIPITIGNVRDDGVASPVTNAPPQHTSTATLPSAPPYPLSNTLQGTPIQPMPGATPSAGVYPMSVNVPSAPLEPLANYSPGVPLQPMASNMPSAPAYPIPNTLPIASAPAQANIGESDIPDTPPPPYSEY